MEHATRTETHTLSPSLSICLALCVHIYIYCIYHISISDIYTYTYTVYICRLVYISTRNGVTIAATTFEKLGRSEKVKLICNLKRGDLTWESTIKGLCRLWSRDPQSTSNIQQCIPGKAKICPFLLSHATVSDLDSLGSWCPKNDPAIASIQRGESRCLAGKNRDKCLYGGTP